MGKKIFAGPAVKRLRERRGWSLAQGSAHLQVSPSYLSQIENNQRAISTRVALALKNVFGDDAAEVTESDEHRLLADLREAVATRSSAHEVALTELKRVASVAPRFAREYLDLHLTHRRLDERLKLADRAVALDGEVGGAPALPYEEVRDYFHYQDNYIHDLDVAGEVLARRIEPTGGPGREAALEVYASRQHGVRVVRDAADQLVRSFDPKTRILRLNALQASETRAFQIAYHLAETELAAIADRILAAAPLRTPEAREICRVGLLNYAAGALLMPYVAFAQAARDCRHDVEQLALRFGVSLEQVCHRLSNLQRPGARGVPMYFLRMDGAGNITKRHSATRFHFARFGGTCPLWNVHEASSTPDRFVVQVAEMPEGERYLSVARSILKPTNTFASLPRRYVLGFGCELRHASAFVYADALNLRAPPTAIGVSCRICERKACAQRAFPPVDRQIVVRRNERAIVPFAITEAE